MYFLICSNVHDDVTNFKFGDSGKTQKSKYLENKTRLLPLVKKLLTAL